MAVPLGREKVWRREPALSLKMERSMVGITTSSRRLRSKAEAEHSDSARSSDWVRVVMSTNGRESIDAISEQKLKNHCLLLKLIHWDFIENEIEFYPTIKMLMLIIFSFN